jgi:hypothetical protein
LNEKAKIKTDVRETGENEMEAKINGMSLKTTAHACSVVSREVQG